MLAMVSLQGCRDFEADQMLMDYIEQQPVAAELALTVARTASPGVSGVTRMAADSESGDIVGAAGNVELRCVIPFKDITADDGVHKDDVVQPTPIVGSSFKQAHNTMPFYTSACDFESGVNYVLAYGRDFESGRGEGTRHAASAQAKGALIETFGDLQPGSKPESIGFELQTIKTPSEYLAEGTAQALADYLTAIVKAETDDHKTWKSATNADMQLMYKNFINELSDGVGDILPGSAANVKAWVTQLKNQLNNLSLTEGTDDDNIRTAILAAIATADSKWGSDWKDFPASIGLPDGAAVVRWDGTDADESNHKFYPEVVTTTIADINNIERFTYPAEIYYYGNSPVMVSDDDLTDNFSSMDKWAKDNESDETAVLSGFAEGAVEESTHTVAMEDPMQYGVAELKVKMKSSGGTLRDANNTAGTEVTVGPTSFPLTGVIVGGQLPVGFDFRPESAMRSYTEANMRFIYDSQIKSGNDYLYLTETEVGPTNTLVLQSYGERSLKLVLEFINNSDKDFKGSNGIVYRGTKFYLVGEVTEDNITTASSAAPAAAKGRVFTQDYTTTLNVTVSTLAKAYNVLPNLLSPRLEMGLELTPKWVQATTTDVEL